MKNLVVPLTPLTDETFERQGWRKHQNKQYNSVDELLEEEEDDDEFDYNENGYFYTLSLPKTRNDRYTPMLVTNVSNDFELLKTMKLKPGHFFIEIMDFDGLGFCSSEEELEVLYKALTNQYIEE